MNYIYLGFDYVEFLHNQVIDEKNISTYNHKSVGLLKSVLEHIQNDEYYPTFASKITHLIFCCVKFHPFVDGNKRTAIMVGLHFLLHNGFKIDGFIEMMEEVVVGVAENSILKDELEKIIANYLYN